MKQFFCAARPRLHGSDCPSDTLNTSRRKSRRINCRSFTDLYLPKQLFHAASFTVHAVKQFFRAVCLRLHGSDCASYTLNTSRRKSRRINCRSFTDLYLPKQLFHTTSFTIHAAKQRVRETSFTVHTVKQFFRAVCLRLHGSDCASYTLNTSRRKSRRINCRSFTDLYLPKQLFHTTSFTVHAVKQRFRAVKHSSDCKTTVSCDVFRNSCHKETVSYNEPHGLCRGSAAL